ncbi:MAG: hypothetical protein JW889_02050, partial [Verrucomicrobia bacterium]|nr:hypothetical protein [Verrucomicrobiota bacterium]
MVDLVGEASVTWEEYDTVTITAARLIFDGTSVGEESNVNATSAEIDPNPAVNLANRSNTIRMEIDLSIDVDGDEVVDYTRTYVSPRQVIYYHQSLLSVDATDQYTSEQQGDNSMLRQYWNSNWYDASPFDEEWTQTAYTCRYANKVGTTLWTYEAFSEEYAVYERSLFDYEAVPNGHSTSGTPDIDWVFQMAPRRRGLTAASAILNMSTGYPDQRLPQMGLINPYFGTNEADLGAYTVMGNVLWSSGAGSPPTQWYTTCSSLAAYQPTPLTSTAPHFEVPETGCPYLPSLGGYHYAFPNNDFCWFYVLVEDSFPNDDESLIPNYIYVESSPTPVEAGFSTDAGHPLLGPYGAYDWTEYDYEDPEAPRLFIQIRAGQSAGEGDFADDTDDTTSRNAVVGIDGSRWTLPPEEPGETIEIPLAVEYHWPEVHESPEDGAVTTGTKTVYAQKGIVVRVEVAQEIWAGESRPIYATLNGKYNDGGQTKTGDVPWTYPIEWQ